MTPGGRCARPWCSPRRCRRRGRAGHHGLMPEGRKWRRRVGTIKTAPWNRIGPYFPDRLLDGGHEGGRKTPAAQSFRRLADLMDQNLPLTEGDRDELADVVDALDDRYAFRGELEALERVVTDRGRHSRHRPWRRSDPAAVAHGFFTGFLELDEPSGLLSPLGSTGASTGEVDVPGRGLVGGVDGEAREIGDRVGGHGGAHRRCRAGTAATRPQRADRDAREGPQPDGRPPRRARADVPRWRPRIQLAPHRAPVNPPAPAPRSRPPHAARGRRW